MLKLINLSKEFLDENGQKKIALKNINAEFDYGNVVAVIGENGSGKSTLLNIIATFLKPSNGLVLLNEKIYLKILRSTEKWYHTSLKKAHS